MTREDGNGFVRCDHGHLHWGLNGAAGLLLSDPARGVLLQRRAWWVHHGRTWALPGGAVEAGESAREAATREAHEEADIPPARVRPLSASHVDHGNWRYTTILAAPIGTLAARVKNAESAELRWVHAGQVADFRLHRDFAVAWPGLREHLDRRLVLVVDGANVVGSRPDGWWRDRRGAAERLRDKLAALAETGFTDPALPGGDGWSWWPKIVLVVEGKARGVETVPGVDVVEADGEGDDKIVAVAREARAEGPDDHVVVVTADRELRSRVEAVGASAFGPGTLLEHLG
ncbi:NUDIX domain-containing protein [Amycolatopsis sp. NPDC089917]|uniref:NUDIX domain-containing protein n=1 Tax=Amycolatopsis sp. NPDC089917 TaxID=3155187 RepID=UPI00341F358D